MRFLSVGLTVLSAFVCSHASATFTPLTGVPLPNGGHVMVSGNGKFVAGDSALGIFRWQPNGTLEIIPKFPEAEFNIFHGISPSGEYIVGEEVTNNGYGGYSTIWRKNYGTQKFVQNPNDPAWAGIPLGVRDDGLSILDGGAGTAVWFKPYGNGAPVKWFNESYGDSIYGISGNAGIPFGSYYSYPKMWNLFGGYTTMNVDGIVFASNYDGSLLAGYTDTYSLPEGGYASSVFVWKPGANSFQTYPSHLYEIMQPEAASSSAVFGVGSNYDPAGGFPDFGGYWALDLSTSPATFQNVGDYLAAKGFATPTQMLFWSYMEVLSVSADGHVLVGRGVPYRGKAQYWYATNYPTRGQ